MEKKLVYMACPYSHNSPVEYINKIKKGERFRQANIYAANLLNRGEFVYSPISHCHPLAMAADLPGDWEFWEAYDRAILACCKKLYVLMLPGWETSKGVQAEIKIAIKEFNIPVEYIDPDIFFTDK